MILITGANAGIGLETAAQLAEVGSKTVMLAGRRPAAVDAAVADIRARPTTRARVLAAPAPLDLASPRSVIAFAAALKDALPPGEGLSTLINNAGIADAGGATAAAGSSEADRWPVADAALAVNHVGVFALTRLLLPLLLLPADGCDSPASPPRVVTLSSHAHRSAPRLDPRAALAPAPSGDDAPHPSSSSAVYGRLEPYTRSKLCNALFAAELARRVNGGRGGGGPPALLSVAVSPGFVRTGLAGAFIDGLGLPPLLRRLISAVGPQTPARGARTSVWAATAPVGEVLGGGRGGGFVSPTGFAYAHAASPAPRRLSAQARDARLATELWVETEACLRRAGVEVPEV